MATVGRRGGGSLRGHACRLHARGPLGALYVDWGHGWMGSLRCCVGRGTFFFGLQCPLCPQCPLLVFLPAGVCPLTHTHPWASPSTTTWCAPTARPCWMPVGTRSGLGGEWTTVRGCCRATGSPCAYGRAVPLSQAPSLFLPTLLPSSFLSFLPPFSSLPCLSVYPPPPFPRPPLGCALSFARTCTPAAGAGWAGTTKQEQGVPLHSLGTWCRASCLTSYWRHWVSSRVAGWRPS